MALRNTSLFLYGFNVTNSNNALDFKNAALGPELQATLRLGTYNLSTLAKEITRALREADPANQYDVGINRNVGGGLENRVIISTTGTFLSLLFNTGTRAGTSCRTLIGFQASDYTGNTTYTGLSSAGTRLIPNMIGYNFLGTDFDRRLFGSVNVSASGVKEAIVFAVQNFWQVQFKYIPEATWISQWTPFFTWMIQQRPIEFTPDISDPDTVYGGTLESTPADGKALAFRGTEMLPDFPFLYDTGILRFRQIVDVPTFV